VFAGSSATYGDHPGLPKVEDEIGNSLSPYAVTKHVDELYARVFGTCYGLEWISLRYFNVFGPRQDPNGAYAAVIPRWTYALVNAEQVVINGDGETSRDFCYIGNVVQANLRAALVRNPQAANQIYNIAVGERTTLNQLYETLRQLVSERHSIARSAQAVYGPFREGDVRHSLADISKAMRLLGYKPAHYMKDGLRDTVAWFTRGSQVRNLAPV
jgi:UDP-N-acetylglucosamine/UDP-N-acetylgalactosamine 4-epimerase